MNTILNTIAAASALSVFVFGCLFVALSVAVFTVYITKE